MNSEARRKIINVATAILAEPYRYRQDEFASIRNVDLADEGATWYPGDALFCKTAFCIAGWNHALYHAAEESLMSFGGGGEWAGVQWSDNGGQLVEELRHDFDFDEREAALLCSQGWKPRAGLSVFQALVGIAFGATVADVTDDDVLQEW